MTGAPTPYSGAFDTLAGDSSIRLFGRPMFDIVLADLEMRRQAYGQISEAPDWGNETGGNAPYVSSNAFLIQQLLRKDAQLARIHTFSYQNELYDLAKPTVFLVHGPGVTTDGAKRVQTPERPLRKEPSPTNRSGLNREGSPFSTEMRVWVYDRADFTVRLDTDTGPFDALLLDFELGGSIETNSMHGASSGPGSNRRPISRRRRWRNNED